MTANPANQSVCAECGASLSRRAPEGLCTRCLLESGVHILTEIDCRRSSISGSASPLVTLSTLGEPASTNSAGGRFFGDYELLDEIARGGMGVVFRARQVSLNRIVAVKMLKFGAFTRDEFIARFRAEAEAAATLRHPNIVAIHACGECLGERSYSMEFIKGKNLADWIQGQPLNARRAAELTRTVALAVRHAHAQGILHRDLKPSNILLDSSDKPYVSDFGLARRIDDDSSLTLTGQAIGSPNYMAPEQAAGARDRVGVRSDVWSLGAIFYYLLTARPPFAGSTVAETLRALQQDEPARPRLLNSAVPAELETVCLKCLEKEPAKRYATAQEFADDLGRFLRNEPIHARPVTRSERAVRWCQRKPALASFIAATALLLVAIFIGSPIAIFSINQERERAEKGELDARQIAYASDMNRAHQAIQKDDLGEALQLLNRYRPENPPRSSRGEEAVSKSPTRNPQSATELRNWEWRYLWRLCQGEERFILGEHTNPATAVGLFADGKRAFSAGRDKSVRLWDLESRRQIGLLAHSDEVIGAVASPDGRWLATATEKEAEGRPVQLWDLATRKIVTSFITITPESTNAWLRPRSITFSSDNRWLAFASVFVEPGICVWDVEAQSEVAHMAAVTDGSSGRIGLAFSPDTHTLAYNENEFGAILLWDIASRSIAHRLAGHRSFVRVLTFSPDGHTLASGSQDRTVRLWSLGDRRVRSEFINENDDVGSLAFSPDGRTLAIGSGRVIGLVDVETGRLTAKLRGHRKTISDLVFTPDGQTVLSASEDGTIRVWDAPARTKEKSAHLFAQNSISLAWRSVGPALFLSPDGRHLLTVYTNQTFSVWDTLRLAEGERHPLPFTNTTIAAVAVDGRLAAFASQYGELILLDVERSRTRSLAQLGTNQIRRLVFSRDGRYLAAANEFKTSKELGGSNDDPRRTVRVWDVAARKVTRVFSTDGQFLWTLMFSADGKSLIAGTWRGQVKLWPLHGPLKASTFEGHGGVVSGLALLSDGQTLISAARDMQFWDVRTRRENALNLDPRAGHFSGLALSPDGHRLAAGEVNGRITLLDVASHEEVATLEGHREAVTQLAFTPDGDHLVSVSKDQLRVWPAASFAETDIQGNAP